MSARLPRVLRWSLAQNRPNPFSPSTAIGFELAAASDVQLRIYDAAGRRVRTVLDRRLPPGAHTVVWDGRDDGGRRLAAGIYFCHLEAAGFTGTRKLTLMR